MTNPIERLAELVRQAEATARSERLESEVDEAAAQLREAERRSSLAAKRLEETRAVRMPQLEQADVEEQQLKELIRKTAQLKSHLTSDQEAEKLIVAAQNDIESRRREARADLEAAAREADEARCDLKSSMERYESLRREVDRLQPQLAEGLSETDGVFQSAEIYFPGGQLRALAKEVDDSSVHFGLLSQREQYAQMKIWIGRLRRAQTEELSEEEQALSRRVFTTLVGLSKEYEPGYIDAFQQHFTTDWDSFVRDAEQQLQQAVELSRRRRESERQVREQQLRDEEKRRQAREAAQSALDELKGVIASYDLPREGLDEFRNAVRKVISGLGASDTELLELVLPYRDVIAEGNEFRALRRNLDRLLEQATDNGAEVADQNADLLPVTQGSKVLMIGGARREDVRRQLAQVFGFAELDWEDYEGTKPAVLDSLEQRVRNRGVDLVLILKSFISHHVPGRLRPLCEQQEIPCLMVEHGYGPVQVAETLRRGLLKEPGTAGGS